MERKIIRVGTTYYEEKGRELQMITAAEAKKAPVVTQKYDGFTNLPHVMHENGPWNSHWNLWNHEMLMEHPGSWGTIEQFLRHFFQDKYELGLNYLQVAIFNPTSRLPVLGIITDYEDRVGTSTFLWLLNQIQPGNVAVILQKELHGGYNDRWITKNFVAIEEIPNSTTLEVAKILTASRTAIRNAKYQQFQEIPSWCKFILEKDEPIDGAFNIGPMFITNPDKAMPQKMTNEVPGFIYDLKRRHPETGWGEIIKTLL